MGRAIAARGGAAAAAIALLLMVGGCRAGAVYQHTIQPLTTDFDRTPVMAGPPARASVKRFRYGNYVDVSWDDNAIGRIAKRAGFRRIHYADVEVLSILGIWTQTWVRVYGEPDPGARPEE